MIKIQRLNMDNSWYIELDSLKLLVDPWLEGAEIDYFSWFNKQWHRTPPLKYEDIPDYDLVLITQKYPDHFHHKTLIKLQPKNVMGPESIRKKVNKILPNAEFIAFNKKKKQQLFEGVTFHFLPTKRWFDPIYDAFLIDDGKESICLATHGFDIDYKYIKEMGDFSPVTLLMTPFNFYQLPAFLGGTVSPGLEGVKQLADEFNPICVVPTHDEDKHARGLVSKFAKIIKSMSKEDLRKLPWLEETYQPLNHYHLTKIS
ncbi:MBL fold metallo-hydrolase [Flammeovirga sp. EKP202]|uniref:MBL fold metallo-hydrolase n=1 Tax=Flammeovirga sp. EKP202 TaxID=2770592 RepID=UPI00165FF1B1|nr:MBL fold metallo-hydrolase [Flammeovirga sp. EKP202]